MPRDNVHNTGWDACLFNQFAKFQHRGTGVLGRFEHDSITRRQSWPKLDRHQKQLRVPRHHSGHNAQRFALGKDEHVGLVDGQGLATDLVGATRKKVEKFGNILGLPTGFLEHLARIHRLRAPQTL